MHLEINFEREKQWAFALISIFEKLRDKLIDAMRQSDIEALSRLVAEEEDDSIYSLDVAASDILKPLLEEHLRGLGGAIVIGEGLGNLTIKSSDGAPPQRRVLIDPVDGTRCLMYGKRSAWALAAIAPDKGSETRLSDSTAAVMVELPTPRAALADVIWAVNGHGTKGVTVDLRSGERFDFSPRPSRANKLQDGFAMISRFFPGGKDIIAAVEEDLMLDVIGPPIKSKATVFEDQYISTGGQWVELIRGRDRFCADIRRTVYGQTRHTRNQEPGHCVRPHDAAGLLAATEAGVIITDIAGAPLDAPFDTFTDLDWIGYANLELKQLIEKPLQRALKKHGLI